MCDEDTDSRKSSSSEGVSYQSVPDADREMANQAFQEFELCNFEQSLTCLKKLGSKRPQDSKVYHNSAVLEYYLSNCQKTEQFNKKMIEVCKQAHISVQDLEIIDDVDNCIVLYNQAVVLYHLHQFHSAICILDKLFQYIEPLEETLAKHICFLLLECYLCVYQPKKAICLVNYMETMLFGSKSCTKTNSKEKDNQKEESNGNNVPESVKRRLLLCKARCYAMIKTSKACKREIKNLMSSGSQIQNIPAFYLKSQLEYQRGNYRKALKLLNSVTLPENISGYFKKTGDYIPAIFYNNVGCIHFYMGKPNLGILYTEKALQSFEAEMKLCTNEAEADENKLNARPLHLMSISTRHQLMYNLGMHFLQARKFHKAFNCFLEVVQSYHSNPRLWFRIAECCIHLNNPNCNEELTEYKGKSFIKSVVGTGIHRKIIINSSLTDKTSSEELKTTPTKLEAPTLQFGMLCLKNALFLVGEYSYAACLNETEESNNPTSSDEDKESDENRIIPALPSNYLQGCDIMYLRNAILLNSAYVALCLGDAAVSYEYTKMLFMQPLISGAHKFFAHTYAGEALLIMDRITTAIENLNSIDYDENIELTYQYASSENWLKHQSRFDMKFFESIDGSRLVGNLPKWFPDHLLTSKFVKLYNLAVTYAIREEWSKAMESLTQINPNGKVPKAALSLMLYIQCHQGTAEDIGSYVKRNSPQQDA